MIVISQIITADLKLSYSRFWKNGIDDAVGNSYLLLRNISWLDASTCKWVKEQSSEQRKQLQAWLNKQTENTKFKLKFLSIWTVWPSGHCNLQDPGKIPGGGRKTYPRPWTNRNFPQGGSKDAKLPPGLKVLWQMRVQTVVSQKQFSGDLKEKSLWAGGRALTRRYSVVVNKNFRLRRQFRFTTRGISPG